MRLGISDVDECEGRIGLGQVSSILVIPGDILLEPLQKCQVLQCEAIR